MSVCYLGASAGYILFCPYEFALVVVDWLTTRVFFFRLKKTPYLLLAIIMIRPFLNLNILISLLPCLLYFS